MKRSSEVLPIPVEKEIKRLVVSGSKSTKLSQSDVMRQGLKIGVPELVRRLRGPRRPLIDYLDKFAGLPARSDEKISGSRF
jgi:hypothetical protein